MLPLNERLGFGATSVTCLHARPFSRPRNSSRASWTSPEFWAGAETLTDYQLALGWLALARRSRTALAISTRRSGPPAAGLTREVAPHVTDLEHATHLGIPSRTFPPGGGCARLVEARRHCRETTICSWRGSTVLDPARVQGGGRVVAVCWLEDLPASSLILRRGWNAGGDKALVEPPIPTGSASTRPRSMRVRLQGLARCRRRQGAGRATRCATGSARRGLRRTAVGQRRCRRRQGPGRRPRSATGSAGAAD